jgi:hypothetical protein
VRSARELGPPTIHKPTIGVKNNHRMTALAIFVHRVVNIDSALRVLADAVRISVSDLRRQVTPVVDHLVNVLATTHYGTGCAALVGRPGEGWSMTADGGTGVGFLHGFEFVIHSEVSITQITQNSLYPNLADDTTTTYRKCKSFLTSWP